MNRVDIYSLTELVNSIKHFRMFRVYFGEYVRVDGETIDEAIDEADESLREVLSQLTGIIREKGFEA